MDKIKFYKLKLYRVTLQFVSIKCGREQLKSEKKSANQPIVRASLSQRNHLIILLDDMFLVHINQAHGEMTLKYARLYRII